MFIPQQPISISTCAIPINQDTPPMEKKSGLGNLIFSAHSLFWVNISFNTRIL